MLGRRTFAGSSTGKLAAPCGALRARDEMIPNQKPGDRPETPKVPLSTVAEALAKQAAMRPPHRPAKQLPPIQRTPKVKVGRKNRRKIPK